jgi:hypothetical protein
MGQHKKKTPELKKTLSTSICSIHAKEYSLEWIGFGNKFLMYGDYKAVWVCAFKQDGSKWATYFESW